MIWLWIYLAAGVVFLAVMYGTNFRESQENKTSQLLGSMRGPLSTKDLLLEKVIAPALAIMLVVLAWPAVLVYAIKARRDAKLEKKRREDAVFRVRSKDLLRQTSVPEVEAVAHILDPMGAVPNLPFGHLHGVWQAFCINARQERRCGIFLVTIPVRGAMSLSKKGMSGCLVMSEPHGC